MSYHWLILDSFLCHPWFHHSPCAPNKHSTAKRHVARYRARLSCESVHWYCAWASTTSQPSMFRLDLTDIHVEIARHSAYFSLRVPSQELWFDIAAERGRRLECARIVHLRPSGERGNSPEKSWCRHSSSLYQISGVCPVTSLVHQDPIL